MSDAENTTREKIAALIEKMERDFAANRSDVIPNGLGIADALIAAFPTLTAPAMTGTVYRIQSIADESSRNMPSDSNMEQILEIANDAIRAMKEPPTEPTITDEMIELTARMLFARTHEGRSGFTWPVNGEWGRKRSLDDARRFLTFVLAVVPGGTP